MNCPHCDKELGIDAIAKAAEESRITFEITPAEGELFDVITVGKALAEFGKILALTGKSLGVKSTITLLQSVEIREQGAIAFKCIVCRTGNRKARA